MAEVRVKTLGNSYNHALYNRLHARVGAGGNKKTKKDTILLILIVVVMQPVVRERV